MMESLPSKYETTLQLLEEGSVFLHLDPRGERAIVPKHFKNQPQLVLQIGLQMAVPILDLIVDEHGVEGTLSFSRIPFKCIVPWDLVFAALDENGKGMVWPESLPEEILSEIEKESSKLDGTKSDSTAADYPRKDKAHLEDVSKKEQSLSNVVPLFKDVKAQIDSPVDSAHNSSQRSSQKPDPDDTPPKGKPNLRIIK